MFVPLDSHFRGNDMLIILRQLIYVLETSNVWIDFIGIYKFYQRFNLKYLPLYANIIAIFTLLFATNFRFSV